MTTPLLSPLSARRHAHPRVAWIVYRDDPCGGGSLRVAESLARFMPQEGVDGHVVVAYGQPGAIASSVQVPVHCLGARSSRDWGSFRRIREWFAASRFDILHFVDTVQWIFALTLDLPVKRLDHFHGRPLLPHLSLGDRIWGLLHRCRSDAAVAITHGARRAVHRGGLFAGGRIDVLYNGVDVEYFADLPSKAQARGQLGLPPDVYLFGQVARIAQGNACLEMLEVLRFLPENWHAVLVGDGPLRPRIAEEAARRELAGRVHLPGPLVDVRPAYAALDAVVLLSRYQPFCLMLAEAMAAGVPVFGLRGEGEYAEPEFPLITADNAVFLPRNNPRDHDSREPDETYAQLARALRRSRDQPAERLRQVETARRWVSERFSASHQARACRAVYDKLLSS